MYLIRNLEAFPSHLKRAVITIGNFDGVHAGHQQLLAALITRAKAANCPSGVIVFEPQPQEFFLQSPAPRLTTFRQKYTLLKQQGVDFIMVLRFNAYWAEKSAEDFINQVLCQQLQIKEVWVGDDFRFGHNRLGDFTLLKHLGKQQGFHVHSMLDVTFENTRISSTQTRILLSKGELQKAQQLLGHPFSIEGKVVPGDARGRLLNMPTANIHLKHKAPLQGIFVVRVTLNGMKLPAVASLGTRPVFSGEIPILEVHILNFDGDIYGKRLIVDFFHKLRDECNFSSVELLQAQMQMDALNAKNYWEQHHDEL